FIRSVSLGPPGAPRRAQLVDVRVVGASVVLAGWALVGPPLPPPQPGRLRVPPPGTRRRHGPRRRLRRWAGLRLQRGRQRLRATHRVHPVAPAPSRGLASAGPRGTGLVQ